MTPRGVSHQRFRDRHSPAGGVAEDDGCIGMRDQPLDFRRRSFRIEGSENRADMGRAEMHGDGVEAILGDPDHPVATAYSGAQ